MGEGFFTRKKKGEDMKKKGLIIFGVIAALAIIVLTNDNLMDKLITGETKAEQEARMNRVLKETQKGVKKSNEQVRKARAKADRMIRKYNGKLTQGEKTADCTNKCDEARKKSSQDGMSESAAKIVFEKCVEACVRG